MAIELPSIGLGTYENTDPDTCRESVRTAFDVGYRHLDTAEGYGNEAYVGAGLADADVARIDAIDRMKRKVDLDAAPWN